jgi:hypothetical protein
LLGLGHGRQALPVVVYLCLILALHRKGYRRIEGKLRPRIQGDEPGAQDFEIDGDDIALPMPGDLFPYLGVVIGIQYTAVLEYCQVEIHCFFSIAVEPQSWNDTLLHAASRDRSLFTLHSSFFIFHSSFFILHSSFFILHCLLL